MQPPSASTLFSRANFPVLKCRGKSDLGLCMNSELARRMPLRSADFLFWNVFGCKNRRKSALHSGILFASPEVMHKPRSDSPLHFDTRNISQIRTAQNRVCWMINFVSGWIICQPAYSAYDKPTGHVLSAHNTLQPTATHCNTLQQCVHEMWRIKRLHFLYWETWIIHLCDMTPSRVWRESFTCVTWLVHTTHAYAW